MEWPGGGEPQDDAGVGPADAMGQIHVFNCGKLIRPMTFFD